MKIYRNRFVGPLIVALALLLTQPDAEAFASAGHSRPQHRVHHSFTHHHSERAMTHRPVRRHPTPRQRTAAWHCNPWQGPSRLEGPLFALGKGAYRSRCYAHQTYVAHDYRRWQGEEMHRRHFRGHRRLTHRHGSRDWLRNADLPSRVR